MEKNALKAVIDLVEDSHVRELHKLLEHRVVEECVALFKPTGTYPKNANKTKLIQKLSLQFTDLQEPYTALVDMGMIWRMATLTAEDRQTEDAMPYKWRVYADKVVSMVLSCWCKLCNL